MKAVVFEGPQNVIVRESPEPEPRGDGETLIAVIACGLCGSDQQILSTPPRRYCAPGTVIGHEIVAVVQTPSAKSSLRAGDLVVVAPNMPCRTCSSCKRGLINLCNNFQHIGVHRDGGLAERVWVPDELLHRVPDGLDPQIAVLAEPLACVLNGTTRAGWSPEEPVVILGGGPIGLLFLAVAKLAGTGPIVVTEPDPNRAATARRMGADHVVDPSASDADEAIMQHVGPDGAPTVIDTVGTLLATALQVVAKAGEILVFGVSEGTEITMQPTMIVRKEVRVRGVVIARGTFPLALRMLAANSELFAPVISDRVPIDDWDRAKEMLLARSTGGKVVVTMGVA